MCCESEGADPNDEQDTQEEGEEENFDAEYAKMELPHQETLKQQMMHHQVQDFILHAHEAEKHEIMTSWLKDMYLWLELALIQLDCLSQSRVKTVQIDCKFPLTRMIMTSTML